jgi:hypothetical protein
MRSPVLTSGMKLNGAAILIALLAFSSFSQNAFPRSEATSNACDLTIVNALPETTVDGAISQSSNLKVELFISSHSMPKCDSLSLALPLRALNKQASDRVHSEEGFTFDSRAAKPCDDLAIRTSGKLDQVKDTPAQAPQDSAGEAQELAKKLANPVASLISLPLQSNFDFGMGTGSGWRYTLNVQPVIPIALSPNWNLISRTIIPIIHQGNVTGPNQSQNGLGDTVQSLFFSPNKSEPFVWAVGPVFLLPTATDAAVGGQKWGVGPTALVLKQKSGWTYGALANHIWSVAGKSNRADVNATFIQPFLSYTNEQAWTYGLNTESTYDWNGHSWSVPINLSISKLVRFGKQPVSFGGGPKCWVTTPTGGPEGCSLRIVVTALFPKR